MDAGSDNDARFEVGRHRASPCTSRESSPVPKRQKRSLSPASEDGSITVPVVRNEDTETPMPENAPLIRQAVGFSSANTSVNTVTYQATVAPQPVVPYFLPGQAPPPPPPPLPKPKPRPKSSKPRAPRRKKGEHFSSQTSKFKLCGSGSSPDSGFASLTTTSSISAGTSASSRPPSSTAPSSSMAPITSYRFGCSNGNATSGPSNSLSGGTTGAVLDGSPLDVQRTRKSSKRKAPASPDDHPIRPITRPPRLPALLSTATDPHYPYDVSSRGSPVGRTGQTNFRQRTHPYFESPCSGSSSAPGGLANACEHYWLQTGIAPLVSAPAITQSPENAPRPLRMITLLIEDSRSGVPDLQLAEVKVPLRTANDPDDGFWADAAEICEALQSGPSRIDGLAKVYTMRGKFRQFFMRIDQFDQLQVQSAHIGVSKERTLNIFVEAPMPQGQLPRPPLPPSDVRQPHNSSSDREVITTRTEAYSRPTYSLMTREDQMERLSKSSYVVPQNARFSPESDNGSYGHSRRTMSLQRPPRRDQYAGPSRVLTPPIPGRYADTQEEKDEAIANYIRSHIENHPGWVDYMQSRAKPQRVSEVLKQYVFVEDRIRELTGRMTPPHWDGAPDSYVEKHHIWRVLRLDAKWGEDCQETSLLVGYYGKNGSRYEDSRVVDMINDTSLPGSNTMEGFLHFLRNVDDNFAQDALHGRFAPTSP